MKATLASLILVCLATHSHAQQTCTTIAKQLTFCTAGENLADMGAMSTAFPNAVHVALSEENTKYGHAVAEIPVRLNGGSPAEVDVQSIVDLLIQNATQKLWVDPKISQVRFRNAKANGWPGVQAEYRIVGSSEAFGTNYVVDAYFVNTNTLIAIQSFSDADRTVTDTLRAFHSKTMQALQVNDD